MKKNGTNNKSKPTLNSDPTKAKPVNVNNDLMDVFHLRDKDGNVIGKAYRQTKPTSSDDLAKLFDLNKG